MLTLRPEGSSRGQLSLVVAGVYGGRHRGRARDGGSGLLPADSLGLHAFFSPEFRHLFYILRAMALLVFCAILLMLGRRRFLRTQDAIRNDLEPS